MNPTVEALRRTNAIAEARGIIRHNRPAGPIAFYLRNQTQIDAYVQQEAQKTGKTREEIAEQIYPNLLAIALDIPLQVAKEVLCASETHPAP
jgi:hypothetical protein